VAVAKAIHAQRVGQDAREPQGWDSLVSQGCERAARDIIAGYTLDELTNLGSTRDPRIEIQERMLDDVREQMKQQDWGLDLISVTVGSIFAPQEAIEKRIDDWKARRESELLEIESVAEAEEMRQMEHARTQAQAEIFQIITEGLTLPPELDDADAARLMALQLMEAIERIGVSESGRSDQDTSPFPVLRRRLQ
jgi:regulator of protease activity HflC (stomatin/prohibitin superfamily)